MATTIDTTPHSPSEEFLTPKWNHLLCAIMGFPISIKRVFAVHYCLPPWKRPGICCAKRDEWPSCVVASSFAQFARSEGQHGITHRHLRLVTQAGSEAGVFDHREPRTLPRAVEVCKSATRLNRSKKFTEAAIILADFVQV